MAQDRKYAKQNLQRALTHFDYIIQYLEQVGGAFVENGKLHDPDPEKWPEEYKNVLSGTVAILEAMTELRGAVEDLRNSF